MSRRTGWPFPLPDVALVTVDGDGVCTDLVTSGEKYFWEGKLKKSTPTWIRLEMEGFIAIQRERKRIGLEYLTFDEPIRMPIKEIFDLLEENSVPIRPRPM